MVAASFPKQRLTRFKLKESFANLALAVGQRGFSDGPELAE
jgi:hypothetical protein